MKKKPKVIFLTTNSITKEGERKRETPRKPGNKLQNGCREILSVRNYWKCKWIIFSYLETQSV
jgi:hypothetical protein